MTHSFPTRRSSDLPGEAVVAQGIGAPGRGEAVRILGRPEGDVARLAAHARTLGRAAPAQHRGPRGREARSEEHTSELQSLMRISYAVFCLKQKFTNHMQTSD